MWHQSVTSGDLRHWSQCVMNIAGVATIAYTASERILLGDMYSLRLVQYNTSSSPVLPSWWSGWTTSPGWGSGTWLAASGYMATRHNMWNQTNITAVEILCAGHLLDQVLSVQRQGYLILEQGEMDTRHDQGNHPT